MKKNYNSQFSILNSKSGFSLAEMIVAIGVSILLIGAVYTVYSLSQKSFKIGTQKAELDQNARVAMERMSREIRKTEEILSTLPATDTDPLNPPKTEIIFRNTEIIATSGIQWSVTSSGDVAYNGNYLENGTYNSKPRYEGLNGNWLYWNEYIVGGFEWALWTSATNHRNVMPPTIAYYGTGADLPANPWMEAQSGITPAPTVSLASASKIQYIKYYLDQNNLRRQLLHYYLAGNPDAWVLGTTPEALLAIDEDNVIAANITVLKFWGTDVINIKLSGQLGNETVNLSTKIKPRNR